MIEFTRADALMPDLTGAGALIIEFTRAGALMIERTRAGALMTEFTRAGAPMIQFTRADALMFIQLVYQSNASDDFIEQSQLLFMAISFRIVLQEQNNALNFFNWLLDQEIASYVTKRKGSKKNKILVAITKAMSLVRFGV